MENTFLPSKSSFACFVWFLVGAMIYANQPIFNKIISDSNQTLSQSLDRLLQFKLDHPNLGETVQTIVIKATEPVKMKLVPTDDLQCMTDNLYYESATQSYAGKIAVGMVVLNRVKSPGYPNSVCGVIYEGSQSIHTSVCQFSWVCSPPKAIIKNSDAYRESAKVAQELLSKRGSIIDITEGATSYHADYVSPAWTKRLQFVAKIDNHLFYKSGSR